jgi:predicted ArsR family transcriptional regulator
MSLTAADDVWRWLVANAAGRDVTVADVAAGSRRTPVAVRAVLATLVAAGLMERRLAAGRGHYVYRWTRAGRDIARQERGT